MIITISRQAASRGDQVARMTADCLGIPLVNQEVVARASQRMQLLREDLSVPERTTRLGERLAMVAIDLADSPPDGPDWALAAEPSMDDPGYRRVIESMVKKLGDQERCLIFGYPAQVLLAGGGRAVHVLVVAPLAIRVQRMIMREDLSPATAGRVIRESDRDRRAFYQRMYDVKWDDPARYDCVLNTARMSIEEAAGSIVTIARAIFTTGAETV